MNKLLTAMGIICISVSVYAADAIDWSVCDKEVKEFKCSGDDKAIWSCLEAHDKALSEQCQVSHAKGDDMFKE